MTCRGEGLGWVENEVTLGGLYIDMASGRTFNCPGEVWVVVENQRCRCWDEVSAPPFSSRTSDTVRSPGVVLCV